VICTVDLEKVDGSISIIEAIKRSLSTLEIDNDSQELILRAIISESEDAPSNARLVSVQLVSAVVGAIPERYLKSCLFKTLDCSSIVSLRSNEDVDSLIFGGALGAFSSLKTLDLSGSDLSSFPGDTLASLTDLEYLNISRNNLSILPREIGSMKNLKTLIARENNITILPGELSNCSSLRELDLTSNRLSTVLISFKNLLGLVSLLLDDNPLESFPDISCCHLLENISFGCVQIDSTSGKTNVTCSFDRKQSSKSLVINFFGSKASDPVQDFYDLAVCGTNHHPLVIEGLCIMLESMHYKKSFMSNQQALKKMALMALSENVVVVKSACRVLEILSEHDTATADLILESHGDILFSLLNQDDQRKISGLRTIENITRACSAIGSVHEKVNLWSCSMLGDPDTPIEILVTMLRLLGNVGLKKEGKILLSSDEVLLKHVEKIVTDGACEGEAKSLFCAAKRLLSALGLNERIPYKVSSPIRSRGVRILSLDGGGMKGLATIRLLRQIETLSGKPVRELFDLIVGTSTGALLTVALTVKNMSLDECEAVYKELGAKVFKKPVHSSENDESWVNAFYRSFHMRTEHVRAVVVGCKHDTETYEQILKEKCAIPPIGSYSVETLIDTCSLEAPKIALVSTITSVCPAQPFIFRNYEYSSGLETVNRFGSCNHAIWEAVRASSAATYYLDGFDCGGDKYLDGALVANNPSLIALQEAHYIWPNDKIRLLVSVGTGSSPVCARESGISSYLDTGSALLESATGVEEVHKSMTVIQNLLPGMEYHRLSPIDDRCSMELDCVDPEQWRDLESATDDYVKQASNIYKKILECL
jgi:predicted acylesterase/phospholipase RssA